MKLFVLSILFLCTVLKVNSQVDNYYFSKPKDLKIGESIIDFTLPDTNGKLITLSKYRGNYVLLDFWTSTCGACRMDNSYLLKNYKKYKSKGFQVISVSADKHKTDWINVITKDSMIWINVSDLEGNASKVLLSYQIYRYPTYFLVNPKGKIEGIDIRGPQLDKKLKEIYKF